MLTVPQADELCKSLEGKLLPEKGARARVNRFILENLRDGFCSGQPRLVIVGEQPAWSVPVVTGIGQGGEVGEVLIHAMEGSVLGFTPPGEVYRNARQLAS